MNSTNTTTMYNGCMLGVTSKATQTGLTCANLMVLVAAIIGNSVVIYLIKSRTRLRISFNYFISSMACADLIHAGLAIPANISYIYVGSRWFSGPFAVFLCKFVQSGITASIVASITTLTATTIERFLAAKLIMKKPITSKVAKRLIALIWSFSLLLSIHDAIKFKVVNYPHGTRIMHCINIDMDIEIARTVVIIKFVVGYALPLVIMATLYANIIWMLWQNSGSNLQTEQYRSIQRRKSKLIKRLVFITVIFAVCWLPAHIMHFTAVYHWSIYECMPQYWPLICYWMAQTNAAINPVLYLLLTENARALFKSSVHVVKPDPNESRRSGSRRLWLFQSFPSDSRLLTTCVSMQTSDPQEEEKGQEMNDLIANQ